MGHHDHHPLLGELRQQVQNIRTHRPVEPSGWFIQQQDLRTPQQLDGEGKATAAGLTPVECVEFDFLINKEKLEKEDNFKDFLVKDSRLSSLCWGEKALAGVKKGQIIQIERRGYFRCDETLAEAGKVVLFNIPTGKTKGMSPFGSKIKFRT